MVMKLFTHEGCINCSKVKAMLLRIMPQMGMDYESSVTELDIEDAGALADIMMLNIETVPTLNIGSATLTGDPILDESTLRTFLESNLKPST